MSPLPSLVLVPGAWHTAQTYDKITSRLESQGYRCVSVTLPTTLNNPLATFHDDIEATRTAIKSETAQGHDVVVVAHSYGGHVTNSAVKGLTLKNGEVASNDKASAGCVIGIILLVSGFTMEGVAFLDRLGGKPLPFFKLDQESGFAELTVDPRELFYLDLPEEEGALWVSKLQKQSIISLTEGGEYAYPGWRDVPVWYLSTLEDKGLPLEAQHMLIQYARDNGGDVTVREIDSSHSPMLSRPDETVNFIKDAVADMMSKKLGA